MRLEQLRTRFLISMAFGVAAVVGLLFYGDFRGVADSLAEFNWRFLPIIFGLTLFNYAMRFLKWEFYLNLTGIRNVPKFDSFLIFFAGLAMTITPARVGEWIKSYYLRVGFNVPASKSAPIVVAERLSDGYAMILLSVGGLLLFRQGWIFILSISILGIAVAMYFRSRKFAALTMKLVRRVPVVRRYAGFIAGFYDSAFLLFSPRALSIAIMIGVVSWLGEGIALYFVFLGLGAENSFELAVQGIFILSVANIAGGVLLVPGGLGVSEGSITGLTQTLVGLGREAAATSALLIRLGTLWFGVALGLVALLMLTKRYGPRTPDEAEAQSSVA